MKEFILICFLISTLTGAYFYLQLMGYMKEKYLLSKWSGRWLFHPEWFDIKGYKFFKKVIMNMIMTFILLMAYQFS